VESNETVSVVRAFLESYRDAFERLDAAAIADHFAYPSHITGDADEIALMQLSNKAGLPGGCRKGCRDASATRSTVRRNL
jgi:hypothetical protein